MKNTRSAADLVDLDHGVISRRVFWDPDVYEQEQTEIFCASVALPGA